VERHGLTAVNREKHVPRGALSRDKLERLVGEGASIAEIARAVDRSKATVRHWLREFGLRTQRGTMREIRVGRLTNGERPGQLLLSCPHHGIAAFQLRAEGGYRCLKCRSDAVARRRRKVKRTLVQENGGKCRLCGYDRYRSA
jgi:transposase